MSFNKFVIIGGVLLFLVSSTVSANAGKLSQDELKASINFFRQTPADAIKILEKHAAAGNTEAQKALIIPYLNTVKDGKKIHALATELIKKDEADGYFLMGCCYDYGYSVTASRKNADIYYQKAADCGSSLGLFNQALIMEDSGDAAKKNTAEKYYKMLIEKKFEPAYHRLAFLMLKEKRYGEAVKILSQSQDKYSLALLGNCYLNGYGVKTDVKKAAELLLQSEKSPFLINILPEGYHTALSAPRDLFGIADELNILNKDKELYNRCLYASAKAEYPEALFRAGLDKYTTNKYASLDYLEKAVYRGYYLAAEPLVTLCIEMQLYERALKYANIYVQKYGANKDIFANLISLFIDKDMRYMADLYIQAAKFNEYPFAFTLDAVAQIRSKDEDNVMLAKTAAQLMYAHAMQEEHAMKIFKTFTEGKIKRLESIAEKGNPDALFALSEYYKTFPENSPEFKKHNNFFERAVRLNHPIACYFVGNILSHKKEKNADDLNKAVEFYKKSFESRFFPAVVNIPFIITANRKKFANITDQEIDIWYDICEAAGITNLYYSRGWEYEINRKDIGKAVIYYKKAAALNDIMSMLKLYKLMKTSSQAEAENYINQACEFYVPDALLIRGNINRRENQPRQAYLDYLNAYNSSGKKIALLELAQCFRDGYGCDQNGKLALDFAGQALKENIAGAALFLGDMYRDGKGVKKDLEKAKSYYRMGAQDGDQKCTQALADLK